MVFPVLRGPRCAQLALLFALSCLGPAASHADTVASLLGNFTINQYCGLKLTGTAVEVHYAVVFGQLPALRELHTADTNGDGVTSQEERDTYVGQLAPAIADNLILKVDGAPISLRATHWTSSLPTEQGGFSLRLDVDFAGASPSGRGSGAHSLVFDNQNYAGRMGWHEIVVQTAPGLTAFDTNAYDSSLTGGLTEALKSLPAAGPLDERSVHLRFKHGNAPVEAVLLAPRPGTGVPTALRGGNTPYDSALETDWITREVRRLVHSISAPRVEPGIAILALLGALLLGAVHALSPGHGKTIVGAYLIGSRGTPRHAAFLGLTVTVTHTLVVFMLGFATLYASRFIVPERLFPILNLTSALLVLCMGIVLLVQRASAARQALRSPTAPVMFQPVKPGTTGQFWGARHVFAPAHPGIQGRLIYPGIARAHDHGHADGTLHSHGGGPMHSHLPPGARGEKITWRSMLTLGISGGLVPCPSAMVLLLAAVALNRTGYGMLLVVAFSVGLAITLTAVGMMFLCARDRFRGRITGARWPHLIPILSAGTIIVLGVGLCIGALMSFTA
jgi:nickel/cobalt transporter (NicO) family protein